MIDYKLMPRKKLLEHCTAYSSGLHEMSNGFQDLMAKLYVARKRLAQFGLSDPSVERIMVVPIICEGLGVEL